MCLAKSFQIPEQLSFDFERTDAIEGYKNGYNTGVNWDANWMPGGPWVYNGRDRKLHQQSQRNYDAWHEGFKRGLSIRLQNLHFSQWWKENRSGNREKRYYAPEVLNEEML